MTLWEMTNIEQRATEQPRFGYVQIEVFPRNFPHAWALSENSIAPTMRVIRPYMEVLELLRTARDITAALQHVNGNSQWGHVRYPLTYIYVLLSLVPIPRSLWHIYLIQADLTPLYYLPTTSTQ